MLSSKCIAGNSTRQASSYCSVVCPAAFVPHCNHGRPVCNDCRAVETSSSWLPRRSRRSAGSSPAFAGMKERSISLQLFSRLSRDLQTQKFGHTKVGCPSFWRDSLFACTPATKYFCTLCSAVFCTNQSGFKETAFLFALLGARVRFAADAALSAVAFRFRSASLIHAGVEMAGSCFDVCFGEVSSLKLLIPPDIHRRISAVLYERRARVRESHSRSDSALTL